ncbi:MAG: alpha/beta fold hydrolase [Terracidiphilus sp.]
MPSSLAIDPAVETAMYKALSPALIKTTQGQVEIATWGDGPAVLALHGAMGGWDQGVLLARTVVSPHHRFVAVSRPGYLGTALTLGRTPQEQADLCAAALDQLGIAKAAVIAISGGGPTALQFALRHPRRCRGLVMISACSDTLDEPTPVQWHIMKLLARIPGATSVMRKRIAKDPEKAAQRSIRDPAVRARTVNDPEAGPLMLSLQTGMLDRMTERIAGTDNDIRQTHGDMHYPLELVSVPTLVVHGTRDSMVPFSQAITLATRVPGAELLAIEGGEHVSIFTHRNQVKAKIDFFLASLVA